MIWVKGWRPETSDVLSVYHRASLPKILTPIHVVPRTSPVVKQHFWSDPVWIYDGFAGHKCKDCGAVLFAASGDLDKERGLQGEGLMPEDCEETKRLVETGRFVWDQNDLPPWSDEDVGKWSWSW
jgi:hypothetical protein